MTANHADADAGEQRCRDQGHNLGGAAGHGGATGTGEAVSLTAAGRSVGAGRDVLAGRDIRGESGPGSGRTR